MKTKSVISSAKKAGLRIVFSGNRISIESDTVNGSFIDQNGFAVALRTIEKSQIAEHQPQFDERRDCFHYSIKNFVSSFGVSK